MSELTHASICENLLKYFFLYSIKCYRIAEKNGTLGKNQMVNRKHQSVIDAALINEFKIDTARTNQQPLAIQQNNTSVCYDHIIANHASLNSRREETPTNVCKLRANTLHSTQYHVQTALRISKDYQSHKEYPIHGLVQGTGSVGNEWSFISILMIKQQKKY